MASQSLKAPAADFPSLCLIGGGQMGRAMVGGMIDAGRLGESRVTVVDPSDPSRAWWSSNRPTATAVASVAELDQVSDVVILAVKPGIVPAATKQPSGTWDNKLIISIAAGVSIATLSDCVGHSRVVRVMPNTPSLVGKGASAFAAGDDVQPDDIATVEAMLNTVGLGVRVTEPQLDAVTGVSGSGPAYVFLIIESMADGGVAAGLPRDLAMQLATQTVLGAATMVAETGRHPGELKDAVASPAGTTIAGLNVLEQNGVRGAIIDAIQAAADRSRELGRG